MAAIMNGRDLNRAPVIEGMQAVPEENGLGLSHEISPKPKPTAESNEMNESASRSIRNHVSVPSLSLSTGAEDDATPKSSRLESAIGNGYFEFKYSNLSE